MDSPKQSRRILLLLPLLLAVFCGAFFLGRNTLKTGVRLESERKPPEVRSLPQPEPEPDVGAKEERLNLNTATADELTALPGIGPALAGRIVEYREQYGGFSTPEQLMDVPGIGKATYEKLAERITVEDGT